MFDINNSRIGGSMAVSSSSMLNVGNKIEDHMIEKTLPKRAKS